MRPSTLIGTKIPGLPWRIIGYKVVGRTLTITCAPDEPRKRKRRG